MALSPDMPWPAHRACTAATTPAPWCAGRQGSDVRVPPTGHGAHDHACLETCRPGSRHFSHVEPPVSPAAIATWAAAEHEMALHLPGRWWRWQSHGHTLCSSRATVSSVLKCRVASRFYINRVVSAGTSTVHAPPGASRTSLKSLLARYPD